MRHNRTGLLAAALAFLLAGHGAFAKDAVPIPLDGVTDVPAYCRLVQAAVTREEYDVLEATVERARRLETRFPGSKTELQAFYESFTKESCGRTYIGLTEDTAKAEAALAERWLGQKPDSPAAKITNAMIWTQFAWAARGGGYANEVSKQQWQTFADRMRRAAQFIQNVDPDRDAQAYLVLLDLARDLGVSRQQIDEIFRRARDRFPAYLGYYADYATILMPKWLGQPGELADFLKSLLENPGGDIGAMAYARAAERVSFDLKSPDVYRDTGLVWEDLRRGFALRKSRDGLDKHAWISLCYYAVMAGDRAAARDAYGHIDQIDEWPVGGTQQFFLTVLPWIMDRG